MLVIQTNDGLSTADSYASVVELTNYTSARGITLTGNPEQLLLSAMDILESKQYKGERFKAGQSTKFPIKGLGIPKDIKTAQLLLAINQDSSIAVTDTPEAAIKKEKVDVLETEYFEPMNSKSVLLTMIDDLLKPYLVGLSISPNFRVFRG